MFNRITMSAFAGVFLALTAGPAFAGDAIFGVPEPATMTLFGVAAGGAFLARRFFGRR